jgi:hypothetical protein
LLETGSWAITFTDEGYEDIRINIDLKADRPETEIWVDALLKPASDILQPGLEISEATPSDPTDPSVGPLKEIAEVKRTGTKVAGSSPGTRITDAASSGITDSGKTDGSMVELTRDKTRNLQGLLGIDRHHYQASANDKISISMMLEENTRLKVEKYLDNIFTGSDEITVDRRNFLYDYIPEPGENLLIFTFTNADGNIITDEVTISFPAHIPAGYPGESHATAGIEQDFSSQADTLTEEITEDVPTRDIRERPHHGRVFPLWWILVLAMLLLAAFYYKKKITGKRKS